VAARTDAIDAWTAAYAAKVESALAVRDRWVVTHGEPDSHNQMATHDGRRLLVDWESVLLAPPERDLRSLVAATRSYGEVSPDPNLIELFALEWRLSEIGAFSAWFAAPHDGNESDQVAFRGLLGELAGPDPTEPT
jgi:spectinomycin phosphotransferase